MPAEIAKCDKNFKQWAAFVLGMTCMVIVGVTFERARNRSTTGESDKNVTRSGGAEKNISTLAAMADLETDSEKNPALDIPWLGVQVQNLTQRVAQELGMRQSGALVSNVSDGSPAAAAGIQKGDVIVQYDRRITLNMERLQALVAESSPGDRVKVVVARNGGYESLYVKLAERAQQGVAGNGNSKLAVGDSNLETWKWNLTSDNGHRES